MPSNILNNATLFLVHMYRNYLSQFILCSCRFIPSCSNYAEDALNKYGFLIGVWMTACRIARCQPFCQHGYDPVK